MDSNVFADKKVSVDSEYKIHRFLQTHNPF